MSSSNDPNSETEVMYFPYDINVRTSYEQIEHIELTYGDRVLQVEEVRDSRGYLKEFKVTLRAIPKNQFRVQSNQS